MLRRLIENLRNHVSQPLNSELQLLYILVQTRKLIEYLGQQKRFRTLQFYCNWALHVKIDRNSETGKILKAFDTAIERTILSSEPTMKYLYDLLSFSELFRQLKTLLAEHNLPTSIIDDDNCNTFFKYYAGVVSDCPIVCTKEDLELEYVDTIIVSSVPPPTATQLLLDDSFGVEARKPLFIVRWTFGKNNVEIGTRVMHYFEPVESEDELWE